MFRAAESSLSRHPAVGRRRWWLCGSCSSCLLILLGQGLGAPRFRLRRRDGFASRRRRARDLRVDVRDPHPALSKSLHIPTYAVASASLASAAVTVTPGRLEDAGRAGGGTRISGDVWRAGCRHWKSRCGGVLDDPAPCPAPPLARRAASPKCQKARPNGQHLATPNSLFRSVGVNYVSVASPEYSVFSGLTTEYAAAAGATFLTSAAA